MRRGPLLSVLAVALPTVLLGAGWLFASMREQAALQREQIRMLTRTADAVRGAVDESLEELRHREDQRPFYLYNTLYSPPEVISVVDPVARSPLSRDPDDARIVGYFQVEPDGTVRTPYAEATPDPRESPRGAQVMALASSPEFESVRTLNAEPVPSPRASAEPSSMSGFRSRRPPSYSSWDAPSADDSASQPDPTEASEAAAQAAREARLRAERAAREARLRQVRQARRHAERAAREAQEQVAPTGDPAPQEAEPEDVDQAAVAQASPATPSNSDFRPQGPLTTNLDVWNQGVFNDIQQAQQGDQEANRRVLERGRAAPITRRNTVSWDEVQQARNDNRSKVGRRVRRSSPAPPARPTPFPRATPPAPTPAPPPSPRVPGLNIWPLQQAEAEVDYTPMVWRRAGDSMVLARLVSHEGTAVVQGVILDREHLIGEWIPSLVRRHALFGIEPTVAEGASLEECVVQRPVSSVLDDVQLCYPPSALARVPGGRLEAFGGLLVSLELAALAGLVLIVTLAGFTMFRATKRAEELSAQKSAFVSAVSHELRTPLTTIRMHAEMLRDGLVSATKRPTFHQQLVQESVRLSHLVDNVLELSRLEEGRRVLKPREADIRSAVVGVIEEQRPFIEGKGFELIGPEDGDPITIAFDGQALAQIVVNLLDNAVKYGRGEELKIEAAISTSADGVAIIMRDHGPGIPASQRDKVFERFHRVEAPGMAHMPGTGIGLCLVRELARAHGGEAEVAEAEGGGCAVRVVFPADSAGA